MSRHTVKPHSEPTSACFVSFLNELVCKKICTWFLIAIISFAYTVCKHHRRLHHFPVADV